MTTPVTHSHDMQDAPSYSEQIAAKAQWDLVRNDPNASSAAKESAQAAFIAATEKCMQEIGIS